MRCRKSVLSSAEAVLKLGQLVLVSDAQADGGFLTHHFIAQALKDGHLTYLVSFAQSLVHYHSIATKLGVNLSKQKETGNFVFVDCLTYLLSTTPPAKDSAVLTSKMVFSLDRHFSLRGLYQLLLNSITKSFETSKPDRLVCLVLDDLSVLLSLGVSLTEVIALVNYCRSMLSSTDGKCERGGYLVAMVHCEGEVSEVEEESHSEEELLRRYLLHNCDLSLQVSGLSTGYSKDVHGELSAEWRDPDSTTKKLSQFKLTDRTVRLFAKGTSKAVL